LDVSIGKRLVTALLLSASLPLGAALMALALSSPKFWWLGWVTLIPLFISIRILPARSAGFCGMFWGFSLYVASELIGVAQVPHTWQSLTLLLAMPGLYAYVAAAVTRRKGFHPFLLGLGWAGVELALQPLALRHGLLGATQGNSLVVHAVGSLGGYVLVAFLLAVVNAWLLNVITSVQVRVPRSRPVCVPTNLNTLLPYVERVLLTARFLSPAQPRAPPAALAIAFASCLGED